MDTVLSDKLLSMEKDNCVLADGLKKSASVKDYSYLVKDNVWTEAIQSAINENQVVIIPQSSEPYIIDNSIIVPSDRKIVAYGATIRMKEGMDVLMMRNEHVIDETISKAPNSVRDENISICGCTFEECFNSRLGYGKSGKIDEKRSMYGISCCLLFNNVRHLNVTDVTFRNCAGFAVQTGELYGAVFRHIRFENCFADGLHIGGNAENILISDIKGNVGDDLVALNMYDWQNSAVTFGPGENILCEDLELDSDGRYKAIRLEPGIYEYPDGTKVDCYLKNILFRRVKGIRTFKLYYQTPPYFIGQSPEKGEVGNAYNIVFEDMDIDLARPIDTFEEYMKSDETRGNCAAFEICSNVDGLYLDNVRLTLHRDVFPMSSLIEVGPKSIVRNGKEVFDPYLSATAENIYLKNVTVNGKTILNPDEYIKEIVFDDVDCDGHSSGRGIVKNIKVKK